MMPPDEMGIERRVVEHRFLDDEGRLTGAKAEDALEQERRQARSGPEPHAAGAPLTVEDLVRPRQRRDLAVERDLVAAVAAGGVDAREQLLPAAGVVPHERVVPLPGSGSA